MNHYKKKNYIWTTLLLCVMAVGFFGSSAWLFAKGQEKTITLEAVQEEVDVVRNTNNQLKEQVDEIKVQSEQLAKQVEELNIQVETLKKQGIEINTNTEEEKKYAYLTFDDGPSKNTTKILDFLKANNIKATFFVLGKEDQSATYKRIVDEGHTIAIHSNTHDYASIYRTVDTFMEDVKELSSLIEKETGIKPDVLRFPGGSNNTVSHRYGGKEVMDNIIPAVEGAGYAYFDWNVDSMDAAKGLQDKDVIVNSVLSGAKYTDNAVILMHDAAPKTTTVEALPAIVEGLREQGFTFKALTKESQPVKFK